MSVDLLDCLTLKEKVSLLAAADWWRTPTIERDDVFIPHIKMSDGPNGARGESYVSGITAACFPCATCVGATFDTSAANRLGQEIAKETITKSANVLLAPTMNIIRSPLGGRNYETYSEDPVLIGTLAAAFVNGCQSEGIAATPKHFVANDSEKRRTKMTSDIDEQTLREIYMMPFQIVMRDSDPWCFMTSYNRLNSEYCSESDRLLNGVLRKEWGFKGLVVSDWLGTYSTAKALSAGMDLEMPGPTRWRGQKLLAAIEEGEVPINMIDKSVQRVLDLAKKLNRFDSPVEQPERSVLDAERLKFITDVAADGMVVLKNENDILPIPRTATIAVIGQHATRPSISGGGSAKVLAQHIISPLEGLEASGVKCIHSPGVPVLATIPQAQPEDKVLLEWFNGNIVGEEKAHETTMSNAEYMIKEAWPTFLRQDYCTRMSFTLRSQSSGDHIFSVITTGVAKVYIDGIEVFHRTQESVLQPESFYFYKAKIEQRFTVPMVKGQVYKVAVHSWATEKKVLAAVSGTMFQGSSLRFMEYVDIPNAIDNAAKTAGEADIAIVFVGNTDEIESEGYDRDSMDLTSDQYSLVSAIAKSNPKTVVVNVSGSPVTVSSFIDEIPAFLQGWFAGQEYGHSIARVLLGDVNPSGRLPLSWPKRNEDNPAYGNFPCDDNDVLKYKEGLKVGYRYYDAPDTPVPQFCFGSGLSYTKFRLNGFCLSKVTYGSPQNTRISLKYDLVNLGGRDGKQVVQIYVGPSESTSSRPIKELKAFQKVFIKAGDHERVCLQLDKYAFSSFDPEANQWRMAQGDFTVWAAFSSQNLVASVNVRIPKSHLWTGV
ncbi:glycoside hydrolase superfamily [Rhexocercosporidium sp. MPI-PUGE-AT-0058]|nr:glycoside hydrolase superfamily [Rhexocercosporidium sp. MPI-PUGE-AT-0058]